MSNLQDNLLSDNLLTHPHPISWCYLMLTPRWQLRPNLWFFYQNVATREELRGAANTAENLLRNHQLEMSMRLDIYQAEVNAAKNIGASSLNPEEMRLIKKLLLEGERDGLQLPEEQRKVVERLQKDLAEKENKFNVSFFQARCVVYSRSTRTGKLWRRGCMLSTIDRSSVVD